MELRIYPRDIRWWFWAVTLAFIAFAIAGWSTAYAVVIAISALHLTYFVAKEGSLSAFPVQIRLVYFASTLVGMLPVVRWAFYLLLLIGTVMVTFFGRCAIALLLRRMPWNDGREMRLN